MAGGNSCWTHSQNEMSIPIDQSDAHQSSEDACRYFSGSGLSPSTSTWLIRNRWKMRMLAPQNQALTHQR